MPDRRQGASLPHCEHNDVLALLPWCGLRADQRSPMRIDSGFAERFDFAAVGARQPTSRARVLEVRIQFPPAESRANHRFLSGGIVPYHLRRSGGVLEHDPKSLNRKGIFSQAVL